MENKHHLSSSCHKNDNCNNVPYVYIRVPIIILISFMGKFFLRKLTMNDIIVCTLYYYILINDLFGHIYQCWILIYFTQTYSFEFQTHSKLCSNYNDLIIISFIRKNITNFLSTSNTYINTKITQIK